MANTTANPYDRREPRKSRGRHDFPLAGETVALGGYYPPDLLANGRRAYPGFTLGRLEELLRDEFARGWNAGEGTLEHKLEEQYLPRARRLAWDEGHAAGHNDGWAELVAHLANQYETLAAELSADAKDVLANGDATVEHLRPVLARAQRLLDDLIKAQHEGFREVPF